MESKQAEKTAELINNLMVLALINRKKLHIRISYLPHVQWVECEVVHPAKKYNPIVEQECWDILKMKYVRLTDKDANEQLLKMEDEIIELLGEVQSDKLERYEPVTRRGQDQQDYYDGISLESI